MNTHLPFIALAAAFALPTAAQERPVRPVPAVETKPAVATGSVTAKEASAPKARKLMLGTRLDGTTTLPDIDGKIHIAADFRGHVTVVNFWSMECPIMQGYEPTMTRLQEQFAKKGVSFVHVCSNVGNGELADAVPADEKDRPYQRIRDYLTTKKLDRRVFIDHGSKFADKLGAKTTPHVYVFDKTGKLVYTGGIDDDPNGKKGDKATHYLRDALASLVTGDRIERAKTEPYGCSIKRKKRALENPRRKSTKGASKGKGSRRTKS